MEVDVTTQQDDESIKTKSDQFMEEQSETNFEHVFNHGPLHVQETSPPTEQVNNPLLIGTEPIQLVQPNLIELVQVKHVYIFLKTLAAYAQHESLKQVTLFFEQVTLIAYMWPQTINDLADLKSKYNNAENLLEDINNQLQACCLELVSQKKALQNRDNDLVVIKAQLLKQQAKNKHLVANGVEAERTI